MARNVAGFMGVSAPRWNGCVKIVFANEDAARWRSGLLRARGGCGRSHGQRLHLDGHAAGLALDDDGLRGVGVGADGFLVAMEGIARNDRSEEHTSELQSLRHLVCRLL